ncbi:unnamed protein product [Closterium sp. NIES-64]|nr:unnamed protein product [Closterium sp. NIES-64]
MSVSTSVQHQTAQALYTAVVARYSSSASAALGRLSLPYLFPDLSAFQTVADLITHLRTSDARFRAAMPAEFLASNPPPLWLTLYHLVTRLPDTLRTVKDHFLARCPTELTIAALEKELLAAEKSIVAVGASRGDPRTPFFEGCSPSPLLPSVASAAAVDLLGAEQVGSASAPSGRRSGKGRGGKGCGSGGGGGGSGGGGGRGGGGGGGGGSGRGGGRGGGGRGGGGGGGRGGSGTGQSAQHPQSSQELREWYLRHGGGGGSLSCTYVIRTGRRKGQTCGRAHTSQRCFSRLDDAWRAQFPDAPELPRWADLLKKDIDIYALDFDVILKAMYALTISGEEDQYLSVPPDPGIRTSEAAALGACVTAAPGTGEATALALCPLLVSLSSAQDCPLAPPTWSPVSAAPSGHARPGRQRAAPHSSSFPPTTAPLQTLHMDVWGPARVRGQGQERYFLIIVDDYSALHHGLPLAH